MEHIRKFELVGLVETLAANLIYIIRQRVVFTLNKRVDYGTYTRSIEPIIHDEIQNIPEMSQTARTHLKSYLRHLLLRPKEYERTKTSRAIKKELDVNGFTLDIDAMARISYEYFREILVKIGADTTGKLSYPELVQEMWDRYKDVNISVFGNHKAYNMAMTGIEKREKRHLPRQREKIIPKAKNTLAK